MQVCLIMKEKIFNNNGWKEILLFYVLLLHLEWVRILNIYNSHFYSIGIDKKNLRFIIHHTMPSR